MNRNEILARDVGRRRVLQRVVVEPLVAHHIGIQDHRHAPPLSLIRANGVTEPAGTPSTSISSSGLPKLRRSEPSCLVQGLEVDMCAAQRHDKEQPVLLVLEEQVLGVPAGQLALEPGALGHREHRLVLERAGGDAELVEAGEQVLAGGWQGWGRAGLRMAAVLGGRPRYMQLAPALAAYAARSARALQRSPSCCIRPAIAGRAQHRPAWTRV